VCALREAMGARVRSSGPVNARGSSADELKCAFQMILNSFAVRLALPAGEWRAVISYDEF
jgi:hypothetical protein